MFTPRTLISPNARRVVAAFAAQPYVGTVGIDGKMYNAASGAAPSEPLRRSGKAALMDRSFSNHLTVPKSHARVREVLSAVRPTSSDYEYWLAPHEDAEFAP